MKKRLLSIIMALMLCLSFSACTKAEGSVETPSNGSTANQTVNNQQQTNQPSQSTQTPSAPVETPEESVPAPSQPEETPSVKEEEAPAQPETPSQSASSNVQNTTNDGSETTTPNGGVQKVTFKGVHDYTAPERENDYIVQDGRSNYAIVVPSIDTIGKYTRLAQSELSEFFKQATGISLKVIYETGEGLSHNETNRYISIGHTKLLDSTELDYNSEAVKSELMFGGLRIVTVDNSIYLFGATDEASVYAVYDFLQITLNYEFYANDCWVIDEGVRDLKMRDFQVKDIPDAAIRDSYWGYVTGTGGNNAVRFRSPKTSVTMPVGDVSVEGGKRVAFHNTSEILPSGAPNGDPKWQSANGSQLCYTARGDRNSYKKMVEQTASVLKDALMFYTPEEYPDYKLFTITCEDESGVCTCAECSRNVKLYGTNAGSVMVFCNDVMENVDNWWNSPEGAPFKRENFYLMFFAYAGYVECPAHLDEETGEYVVNHPDLELRDDVGVYYAANDINYLVSIYDERNDVARANAMAWFDVAPVTYLWLYEVSFSYYPTMFDTFDHFNSEGFQFYMAGKPLIFLNQAAYGGCTGVTGFQGLKVYLDSKLQWDCTLDSNELTDNWFDAMFGAASSTMRALYNDERLYTNILLERIGCRDAFNFMVQMSAKKNWSLSAINKWLDYIDRARLINETMYKEHMPEMYEMIKTHIDYEFVFPGFLLVNLYSELQAGVRYFEVAKYFQDNPETFKGFKLDQGADSYLSSTWNSIEIPDYIK